ncbi:unnamed protein product [Vitrella brassicaformis CCMP3155]|uniref:Uncharacterized protein n=1 Tax=Vitrella brassicaformis (strain CCMP3155) TaxID=1169540 RepID=A0A0G4ERE2_VITBC|nr:unnamed protein product [Vitrella brassicaformis CCMP3155]|eukprot:CEM00838.1 unnamed protein product [Vitrella brassicaformis CCMP3155]
MFLKEFELADQDRDVPPVMGRPPVRVLGEAREVGQGANAKIYKVDGLDKTVWKLMAFEEPMITRMSPAEGKKYMALQQEVRTMRFLEKGLSGRNIPHESRPFLPVLDDFLEGKGKVREQQQARTGLFISLQEGREPLGEEEGPKLFRVFGFNVFGDCEELDGCISLMEDSQAFSSEEIALPHIQHFLMRRVLLVLELRRGIIRLLDSGVQLGLLAIDNIHKDSLVRIPPIEEAPSVDLPPNASHQQQQQPLPPVSDALTGDNRSILSPDLRMLDMGHALRRKPSDPPPPEHAPLGRLAVLATIDKEASLRDRPWTVTPHYYAPEVAAMLAKQYEDERAAIEAARHRVSEGTANAKEERLAKALHGWEGVCALTDGRRIEGIEEKGRALRAKLNEHHLYYDGTDGTGQKVRSARMWVGEAALVCAAGQELLSLLTGVSTKTYMERGNPLVWSRSDAELQCRTQLLAVENGLTWPQVVNEVLPPGASEPTFRWDEDWIEPRHCRPLLFRQEPCMRWANCVGEELMRVVRECLAEMPHQRLQGGLVELDTRIRAIQQIVINAYTASQPPAIAPAAAAAAAAASSPPPPLIATAARARQQGEEDDIESPPAKRAKAEHVGVEGSTAAAAASSRDDAAAAPAASSSSRHHPAAAPAPLSPTPPAGEVSMVDAATKGGGDGDVLMAAAESTGEAERAGEAPEAAPMDEEGKRQQGEGEGSAVGESGAVLSSPDAADLPGQGGQAFSPAAAAASSRDGAAAAAAAGVPSSQDLSAAAPAPLSTNETREAPPADTATMARAPGAHMAPAESGGEAAGRAERAGDEDTALEEDGDHRVADVQQREGEGSAVGERHVVVREADGLMQMNGADAATNAVPLPSSVPEAHREEERAAAVAFPGEAALPSGQQMDEDGHRGDDDADGSAAALAAPQGDDAAPSNAPPVPMFGVPRDARPVPMLPRPPSDAAMSAARQSLQMMVGASGAGVATSPSHHQQGVARPLLTMPPQAPQPPSGQSPSGSGAGASTAGPSPQLNGSAAIRQPTHNEIRDTTADHMDLDEDPPAPAPPPPPPPPPLMQLPLFCPPLGGIAFTPPPIAHGGLPLIPPHNPMAPIPPNTAGHPHPNTGATRPRPSLWRPPPTTRPSMPG